MFDPTRNSIAGRLTDAVDLLIDFATLGEYGLEPVEGPRACAGGGRQRGGRPQARQRVGRSRAVAQRAH
jgi:hypothetical protein